MPALRSLLAVSALACGVLGTPSASLLFPTSGLNLAAKSAKKLYFGTATNSDQWNDTKYYNILKNDAEFGQVTPANVMKWASILPWQLLPPVLVS